MEFLYPPRLKDPKLFLFLTVKDMAVLVLLIVIFGKISMSILSIIPLIVPISYCILFVRILENKESIAILLIKCFKYFLATQQTYFWGIKRK